MRDGLQEQSARTGSLMRRLSVFCAVSSALDEPLADEQERRCPCGLLLLPMRRCRCRLCDAAASLAAAAALSAPRAAAEARERGAAEVPPLHVHDCAHHAASGLHLPR
jgi:hypothetical protein